MERPVIASLRQRRGIFRREYTLTPFELVIRTRGLLGGEDRILDLNTLARISTVQKPELSVVAVGGMIGALALLLLSVALLDRGLSPVMVGAACLVTLVAGLGLALRVARSRHYVIETWSGCRYPIVFQNRKIHEVSHFIDLLREMSRARIAPADEMSGTREDPPALTGPGTPAGIAAGGDGPYQAFGPSVQEELGRLSRLVDEQFLSPEEFQLRRKKLLEFYELGDPRGEDVTIH